MNTDFTIRIAQQPDALELMSLFQETVLHINKRDYSEAEVADWAILIVKSVFMFLSAKMYAFRCSMF